MSRDGRTPVPDFLCFLSCTRYRVADRKARARNCTLATRVDGTDSFFPGRERFVSTRNIWEFPSLATVLFQDSAGILGSYSRLFRELGRGNIWVPFDDTPCLLLSRSTRISCLAFGRALCFRRCFISKFHRDTRRSRAFKFGCRFTFLLLMPNLCRFKKSDICFMGRFLFLFFNCSCICCKGSS